jgi:hypothetical protein
MKKTKSLLLSGAMLLLSTIVFAGAVIDAPTELTLNDDGSGFALGNMVDARFAANDVELIGCGVRAVDDGSGFPFEFGFCSVRVADGSVEGLAGFCTTTSPVLIDKMNAASDYSFITFAWNANGECTNVGFSTQSFYIPENKKEK